MTVIGRFLEVSVHAPALLESLAFYEAMGFQQIAVNEVRPWPYGVVTDGRMYLGLHQYPIASPTLSFIHADLAQHAHALKAEGIELKREHLGSDEFNEVSFHDPGGQHVQLLEARTFSPPQLTPDFSSRCGYFVEYGMPVREFASARMFWESLGFVALDESQQPFHRLSLTSDHLNIGLHRSRALRHPLLVFEDPDMGQRLSQLKDLGIDLDDEMPDALDDRSNAVIIAPEGTRLLLMQSEL